MGRDVDWSGHPNVADAVPRGPVLWEHHRSAQAGEPSVESIEGALYSDAAFVGEIAEGLDPLRVVSTSAPDDGTLRMQAVAQLDIHSAPMLDGKVRVKTETSAYHGGDDLDEIAALLSLALNVRCRSGGMTRSTGLGHFDGPCGKPLEWSHRAPYLPTASRRGTVLPSLSRRAGLADARDLLQSLLQADRKLAVQIVRSARSFQQAIWVADDDPNLTWLQLVAAIETAAGQWKTRDKRPNIDRLEEAWPEVGTPLRGAPADVQADVAAKLVTQVKATQRFTQFVLHYCPPAPETSVPGWAQVDWNDLEPVIRQIYSLRSRALHDGIPFPLPMLQPPEQVDGGLGQLPTGIASSGLAATWAAEDTPMFLDTFVTLTRGVLLRWIADTTS